MASVFDKLNLKGHDEILVINAPASFEPEIKNLMGVRVIRDPKDTDTVSFALAFTSKQSEVDALAKILCAKAEGDALLWFAYPKGTSKHFTCDFNRDTGFASIRAAGFESVRMIAIDDDWSSLRFRRSAYIKSASRKG